MADFIKTDTRYIATFAFTHITEGNGTMEEGKLYLVQETAGVLLLDIQYNAAGEKQDKEIAYDADDPNDGVLVYEARKILVNKFTGGANTFLPGDKVYWSGVAGAPVKPDVESAEYWIGVAVKAADADDEQVMIHLKGDKISLTEPL